MRICRPCRAARNHGDCPAPSSKRAARGHCRGRPWSSADSRRHATGAWTAHTRAWTLPYAPMNEDGSNSPVSCPANTASISSSETIRTAPNRFRSERCDRKNGLFASSRDRVLVRSSCNQRLGSATRAHDFRKRPSAVCVLPSLRGKYGCCGVYSDGRTVAQHKKREHIKPSPIRCPIEQRPQPANSLRRRMRDRGSHVRGVYSKSGTTDTPWRIFRSTYPRRKRSLGAATATVVDQASMDVSEQKKRPPMNR